MKLLNLDSSLSARKELAAELHYGGDTNNSASMNIWLHKQVMQKLAENGGKVPRRAANIRSKSRRADRLPLAQPGSSKRAPRRRLQQGERGFECGCGRDHAASTASTLIAAKIDPEGVRSCLCQNDRRAHRACAACHRQTLKQK